MGRPRTNIKDRILHAARARFLLEGVDGASLRAIAKDAGTNIGMVFYYYPTKDALFLAVVEEVYAALLDDLEAILHAPEPLRERLRRAFVRLGRASTDEIDVVRLVLREALVSSSRLRVVLERFRRGHLGLLLQELGAASARGEVDPAVPLPLLVAATLGMGGAPQVLRRIAGEVLPFPGLPEPEAVADAAVGLLFRGIGPKVPPPPVAPAAPPKKRPARRR